MFEGTVVIIASFLMKLLVSPRTLWHSKRYLTVNTHSQHLEALPHNLAMSRPGLHPSLSKLHCPLVYHEDYSILDWPESHTFPMSKFYFTAQALMKQYQGNDPSCRLSRPLVEQEADFFHPIEEIPFEWLCGPLQEDFCRRFLQGQLSEEECRRIGFRERTSDPQVIRRTLLEVTGTVLAAQLALRYRIAANVAGGTHHASDQGDGYTILNDAAVATHVLCNIEEPGIDRVLVVDADVHQGDGTAKLGAPGQLLHGKLFTLSIHCESNYPWPKAESTYDVALPDHSTGDEYGELLLKTLKQALDEVRPDLVLYNAGVDVYVHDRLGRLDLTQNDIARRDAAVLSTIIGRKIPVACVVGGGYDKDIEALGRRHAIVHHQASFLWRKYRMWEKEE